MSTIKKKNEEKGKEKEKEKKGEKLEKGKPVNDNECEGAESSSSRADWSSSPLSNEEVQEVDLIRNLVGSENTTKESKSGDKERTEGDNKGTLRDASGEINSEKKEEEIVVSDKNNGDDIEERMKQDKSKGVDKEKIEGDLSNSKRMEKLTTTSVKKKSPCQRKKQGSNGTRGGIESMILKGAKSTRSASVKHSRSSSNGRPRRTAPSSSNIINQQYSFKFPSNNARGEEKIRKRQKEASEEKVNEEKREEEQQGGKVR